MNRITGFIVASLATLLSVALPAKAQPLADRVPQDALLYVGWSGSESMGPAYDASHLKAIVDASNLRQLVQESLPRLLENLGHQDEDAAAMLGLVSAIGGPMWRHPSALYFGPADMTDPNNVHPSIALICDAGAESKALAETLNKLVVRMDPPPVPIKVEENDGIVILVAGKADISAKKKPAVPLSQRKEFQRAMAQVAKDPVAAIYIDAEGGVDMIDRMIANFAPADAKQKWPLTRDAFGLNSLKRIVWTGAFAGKEWSTQAFIESPEPRAGLVKALLETKPLSDDTLRLIPATATIAAAGHFDAGGLLGAIREMVKKIDADASAEFEGGLDQVKQALGLDLQADILDTLGDEWALYSDPAVGGTGFLGMTVVNRLKDPAKAQKAFGQLEQLLNGLMKQGTAQDKITIAFNTTKQGDLTIHYLAIPFIAPAWAIKDGNLYLALYPQVVSGAADHVASKGKSILDNENFTALRKRLGVQNASALSFSDLPKTAAEGYQDVLMLSRVYLGTMDMFGAKTPALAFPTLSKLLPHVTPAASVAWLDADGYHLKSITPFPGSEILSGGGLGSVIAAQQAVFMSAALPSLARARMSANRVKSASNLRQIGQAMLLYANENKGKYPKTAGELILTQDITVEVFTNPETKTRAPRNKPPEELAAWVNTSSDYEYLGAGKNNTTGPDVVLAHEKFRPNSPGINVLFGDGHVEWMQNAQAQQILLKQKQNALKKGAQ